MYTYLTDLLEGNVGEVREGSDWDEESGCANYNGKQWVVGEDKGVDIDEFFETRDINNVVLYKDEYRGDDCYSGWYEEDGTTYWLDVVGEYVVFEMEEV